MLKRKKKKFGAKNTIKYFKWFYILKQLLPFILLNIRKTFSNVFCHFYFLRFEICTQGKAADCCILCYYWFKLKGFRKTYIYCLLKIENLIRNTNVTGVLLFPESTYIVRLLNNCLWNYKDTVNLFSVILYSSFDLFR